MTGKEYVKTQLALIAIGQQVDLLDIESFLACISRAEAVAPLLDPTLYKKACENMQALRELAYSLQEVKTKFTKMQGAVLRTSLATMIEQAEQVKTPGGAEEAGEIPNLFV